MPSSCPGCLAWGDFRGWLCHTCYMFGRGHDAAVCTGCRRVQPLKWGLLPPVLVPGPPQREDGRRPAGGGSGRAGAARRRPAPPAVLCRDALPQKADALGPTEQRTAGSPALTASRTDLAYAPRLATAASGRADPPGLQSARPGRRKPDQPVVGLGEVPRTPAHRGPRLGTKHPLRRQPGPGLRPHRLRRRRRHPAHGVLRPPAGPGPARRPHRHGPEGDGDLRGRQRTVLRALARQASERGSPPASAQKPSAEPVPWATAARAVSRDGRARSGSPSTRSVQPC